MGGHEAGDLASRTVADALEKVAPGNGLDECLAAVRVAIEQANATLIGMEGRPRTGRPPGTTIAALLILGRKAAVAWAGDSRIYRLRAGTAEQITHDHSHVQELLDQGLIASEQAETHPLAHVITRAVGIDEALHLQTARYDIRSGDRFLLCTDGLSRLLSLDEIEDRMRRADNPEEAAHALMQTALDRGAPDNVTVVAIEVG